MSWDGRTLTSQTLSNGTTVSYAYNSSGIRTQKTYGTSYRKDYLLDGTTIVAEIKTNLSNNSKETIYYFYDETGVAGFEYNGAKYHYIKNLQGDIISIQNANGIVVVNYAYDAWGNVLSLSGTSAVTIGTLNPFRYRGYYYDTETGYYYLNSRYYDPVVGRFLNADCYLCANGDFVGYNLFAYCSNNPSTMLDSDGYGKLAATLVRMGVSIASNTISQLYNDIVSGDELMWGNYAGAAIGGATEGLLSSFSKNSKANAVISTAVGTLASNLLTNLAGDTDYTAAQIIANVATDVATAYVTECMDIETSLHKQYDENINLYESRKGKDNKIPDHTISSGIGAGLVSPIINIPEKTLPIPTYNTACTSMNIICFFPELLKIYIYKGYPDIVGCGLCGLNSFQFAGCTCGMVSYISAYCDLYYLNN